MKRHSYPTLILSNKNVPGPIALTHTHPPPTSATRMATSSTP
ncbi:hypothetical protein [Rubritalea tangerina]